MNEQENIKLVQQCYDLYGKGDIQQLLGCMTEDVAWEEPAVENLPFTGKRQGREAAAEFFQLLNDMQTAERFEPQEFIAQDDKVVVTGHYVWTVKSTGAQYESDWTHIFTIRDGKVAAFREFTDTHAAAMAYQSQQAGMIQAADTQPDAGRPSIH